MRHVLIVDDNPDTRAIYENCSTDDVRLTTVPDGATALQIVDETPFDAVLLDLSMHPLDGLAVAQEIRRNEETHSNKKPVHLAFFTARVIDEEVQEVAAETNVEMIFNKPCDPFVLVERISLWLNSAARIQGKRQLRPSANQKGSAPSNWLIVLFALFLQGASITAFFYLNHQTQESWAIKWSEMKSQRDAMKIICDSNSEKKNALEVIIQKGNIETSPELVTERPCVVNKGE
jgi:CheY-like chemotaxis protein